MNEQKSYEVSTVVMRPPTRLDQVKARLEFGALTHPGRIRRNNEDQFFVARGSKSLEVLGTSLPAEPGAPDLNREGYFLMVADGIGGCAGGEHASAMVVKEAQ